MGPTDESHILNKTGCTVEWLGYIKFNLVLHTGPPPTAMVEGKGKAVLLQAWGGPVVSRKLRFPDFMTTAQDGGEVVSLTHQLPLPPGNTPGTHFC